MQPQTIGKAMDFLIHHSYRDIEILVEELSQEQAKEFWNLIEPNWRGVAFRSGRGGRSRTGWTSLLRKMVLFERKAETTQVRVCDKI